jgi:PAS domain S-box-containing protein
MGAQPLEEGTLVELEGSLVELLDAAADGVLLATADGRIAFANEMAEGLFGYAREALVGESVDTLVATRDRARYLSYRETHGGHPLRPPTSPGIELDGLRNDGSEFPLQLSVAPLICGGTTLNLSIVRDATERRAIEEQRLCRARSRAVEEVLSGLEAIEYRLIDANGAIHQVRDVVAVKRDGAGGSEPPSGVVVVDVGERPELEAKLSHAQKMEAVGQLAGGIAHDFNNLLTIVSGYARRLRNRDDLTAAHHDLDQIVTATDRAAELTRQLLVFARRGQGKPEMLDPSETVRALEPMLRRLIDADIVFDFDLDRRVPRVLMDRTEFEQILMNLIINARDAMPDGGTLTVTCRTHGVSDSEAIRHGVRRGNDVELSISDTGVGIPPDARDRVFEPFFTTKADKGTGMGLATVYGIVDQAGGWIDLETAVGEGTTFRVMLPVASPVESEEDEQEDAGRPTLLLVEDEPTLRQLVVTMLEEARYTVLQAGNGLDAIALAERHRGRIDLLITDVVMPRLSGPELAEALRGRQPGLDVLFMSGYNDSRLVSRGVEEAHVELLAKPFRADELLARVRALTTASRQ